MNATTQILFELGRPKSNIHWPDYLQYGFDTSDVPALLTLTADETLHSADSDSHQIWVPLHAWRVLGQLRSEQAVEPLLNLFERLFDDDWACDELPEVMAMIGAPAIDPLATYLNNREQSEWARVLAVDSMAEVALRDNALRDRVVQRFRHYMAHPDMEADELNGELISRLIDLDATETIEEIRDLFNRECVDLTVVGDLEDVEMELGLREERTTPRQNLFFSSNPRLERPEDSDDPIAMLEYYLALYGDEDSIENVSELDGFLTAIACAPGLVPPHRWVPAVWGGQTPAWESPQDASEFNDMLHMCHEFTVEFFLKGDFDPLFFDISENSEHRQIVEDWCIGFLRGVELWGPLNPTNAAIAAACFKPILLFGTEEGFTELEGRDESDIIALQNEIRPNILRLYEQVSSQARTQRKPQTVVSKTPKVGRNDPCPCGSGQKYKKCCLQ